MENQVKNSFDLVSVQKLLRDTAILFGPQIIIHLAESLKAVDFGKFTPLVGLILSGLIYGAHRYMQGNPVK